MFRIHPIAPFNGLVKGKIYRKTPYFMGKSVVSGEDFPFNQSIAPFPTVKRTVARGLSKLELNGQRGTVLPLESLEQAGSTGAVIAGRTRKLLFPWQYPP